ncbi:MAG: S8 family serine peptidase [Myxococcales bacterium]|nr:S8 family serine peptidase [Myxococcales bacterium]MDH5565504.1 S8 family serine peptidase [Myxococcales bacterium]
MEYAPDVGRHAIAQANASHGTRVLEVIPELGIYRLSIPADRSVSEMVDAFRRDPRCKNAEPNSIGRGGDFVPADSFFAYQWPLHNTGQFGGTPDADIDAVEGWQISRGDESVAIAVLDSGIDFDHPEFAGRILPGFDFVDEDEDPTADHAHGVWVAGILAANADNLFSVAGVDHFARILPVKVLNAQNFGSVMDLAQGLVFAADQGAEVINMSLINYPITGAIRNALQYARDAGAVLVACAGNGGIGDADRSGPGRSPLVISVGATTRFDERAEFSGTGSALDVVAPGEDVPTVAAFSYGNSCDFFTGCSAATPIASGIASLLLSLDPLPTHQQVLDILTETADDLVGPPAEDTPGRDDFFGYGRVNLNRALLEVPEPARSFQMGAGAGFLALLAWACSARRRTAGRDRSCVRRGAC